MDQKDGMELSILENDVKSPQRRFQEEMISKIAEQMAFSYYWVVYCKEYPKQSSLMVESAMKEQQRVASSDPKYAHNLFGITVQRQQEDTDQLLMEKYGHEIVVFTEAMKKVLLEELSKKHNKEAN